MYHLSSFYDFPYTIIFKFNLTVVVQVYNMISVLKYDYDALKFHI